MSRSRQRTRASKPASSGVVKKSGIPRRIHADKVEGATEDARIDGRVDGTNTRVDNANARIDNLTTRVDSAHARIDNLTTRVNGLAFADISGTLSGSRVDIFFNQVNGSLDASRVDNLFFSHVSGKLDSSRIDNLGFGAISGSLNGSRLGDKTVKDTKIVMSSLFPTLDNRYALKA